MLIFCVGWIYGKILYGLRVFIIIFICLGNVIFVVININKYFFFRNKILIIFSIFNINGFRVYVFGVCYIKIIVVIIIVIFGVIFCNCFII